MRMWNINPKVMCRQHLLGEHVEMHMFKGTIEKKKSISGYLKNGLVNIGQIKLRHDELVEEMKRRGFNHKSPMLKFKEGEEMVTVDSDKNYIDLLNRCEACRMMIK